MTCPTNSPPPSSSSSDIHHRSNISACEDEAEEEDSSQAAALRDDPSRNTVDVAVDDAVDSPVVDSDSTNRSDICKQADKDDADDDNGPIYYFGYGPIVNPVVRKRRGVQTLNAQAAMLPEYRLTFAYGGVVNAIRQRGYEVQGVLMAFETQEDWARFQEFDAGYNLDQVQVFPLSNLHQPIMAHAFLMDRKHSDQDKLDGPLEKLPQERYLKLIAAGMRAYQIDEDYIEDHIMSVPYVPKTKPEDFKTFPNSRGGDYLPPITFHRYQERLCRMDHNTTSSAASSGGDVYFVVGQKVIRVDPQHDHSNPCSVWLRERAHGQPDITLTVHRTVVDPDLPMVDDPQDITPLHVAWAENHFVEWLEQGGLSATAMFRLSEGGGGTDASSGPPKILSTIWSICGCHKKNTSSARRTPRNSPTSGGASGHTGVAAGGGGGGGSTTHANSSSGGSSRLSRMGSLSRMGGSSSHRITMLRGSSNSSNNNNNANNSNHAVPEALLDSPSQQSALLSMELMNQAMAAHPDLGDTTDDDSSSGG